MSLANLFSTHPPTAERSADPAAVADRLRLELEDALERRGAADPAVSELAGDLVDLVQRVVRGASAKPADPAGSDRRADPEDGDTR